MTGEERVHLIGPDDVDLDAVLRGEARAAPEMIVAIDAEVSATAEASADGAAAVAYVAALHLASADRSEWERVRVLLQGGGLTVDDIAERLERGLGGDEVAAAGAEAIAAHLAARFSPAHWPGLPAEFAYLLGSAVVAGSRARPVRRLPWARLAHELLITRPTADAQFRGDETWVQVAHLLADVARTSADQVGDPRLYQVAVEVLEVTSDAADRAGLWLQHCRRVARTCLGWVRNGGPPELLDAGLRAAIDGADRAEAVERLDLQDLAARTYSLRADLQEEEADRLAACELWEAAAEDAGRLGERTVAVRLRVNLASELGLLGKMTSDLGRLRRSIAVYYAARRIATQREEHAQILSGLANRYRSVYDLTSRRDHLEQSIALGRKAITALRDDHARSVALNNQATRYRRRYEDFGDPADLDTAISLAEEAVDLMPPSRLEHSKWLANLSQHYRLRAELTGAMEDATRARRYARRALRATPDDDSALDAYVSAALITPALTRRRLDHLVALTEAAATRPGPPRHVALRMANLAHVLARRFEATGSPDDALRAARSWDAALDASAADQVDRVGLLSQAGAGAELLYEATGDPAWLLRAVERHLEAVRIAETRQLAGPIICVANVNLANSLARHGELVLARDELDRAVTTAEAAVTKAGAAQREAAYTALGGALLSRHEHQAEQEGRARAMDGTRAIAAYRSAYAAARTRRGREAAAGNVANALFHVGYALGDLELLNESTRWYEESTKDAEPEDAAAAIRLTNLGFAALTVAGSEPDERARAHQLEVAARAFDDASRHSSVLVDLRVALGRARTAAASGDWPRAAKAAEQAAEQFKAAAPSFAGGRYAQATLRLGGPLPAIGALAHLRSGDPHAAVRHLEQTRATLLHSEVFNGTVLADALEERGEAHKAAALRSLVARARTLDAQISERATGADVAALRSIRSDIAAVTDAAYANIGAAVPEHDSAARAAVTLAARGVPVVYLVGDDHGGAVVRVNPDGSIQDHDAPALATRRAGREAKTLRRLTLDLRTAVAQHRFRTYLGNVTRELGAEVGQLLLDIGSTSGGLLLVPVGSLGGIPWHALEVAGRPLVQRLEVLYQPTATLGLAARRRLQRRGHRCCVVSFVPEDSRQWAMPAEAAAVTRLWTDRKLPVEEFVGEAARVEDVAASVARSTVAHIAAHAFERPLVSESGIVLADGVLSARRVLASGAPPGLLFLAACSTGRTSLEEEEEFTLSAAGIAAGAATVVATMWPVPDAVGTLVAEQFYDAWLNGLSAGQALRTAQLQLLEREGFQDPFFWAGYTAMGA